MGHAFLSSVFHSSGSGLKIVAATVLTALGTAATTPLLAESTVVSQLPNGRTGGQAAEVSPFCQTLAVQFSPFTDRAAFSLAIDQGGDLNQPCLIGGEQWLPLNYLLVNDAFLAQRLIDQGVDVNVQDGEGNTPLHYVGVSPALTQALLAKGANVNARNQTGTTPLHNVFAQKTAEVMALLIEAGAEVNARNDEQLTPLHFTYNTGSTEIADLLIRHGAEVNARSNQDFTPLHYAIADPGVVEKLLQAGADLTLQNRSGAPIHSPGLAPAVLQLLLDYGADVNQANAEGQTPLHVHRFNLEIIGPLLAAGADVNRQDSQGRTALFDVNLEVARQLLAAGANLMVQDRQGRTALHQAVLEEQSYFGPEVIALFLSQAQPQSGLAQVRDNQGETALDLAQRLGKTEMVNLLQAATTEADQPRDNGAELASNAAIEPLQRLLQAQDWAAADRETRRLLTVASDPYALVPEAVTRDQIRAIDQAWLTASNGRFGLSVQLRLWQAAQATHPGDNEAAINAFRDRVGWKLITPRPEQDFISSDWLNESELTYSLQAPVGHLPWAGVSDATVQAVLAETVNGCGSCTTDAMQLRNERFYGYLPSLFTRVQSALNPPVSQGWQSPQVQYRIDLAALYPRGSQVRPHQVAISADSQLLAVASTATSQPNRSALALWNLASGTRRITLLRPESGSLRADALVFSPDSRYLWAGLSNGNMATWDTNRGTSIRQWSAHRGAVMAIAIAPQGNQVISGGSDGTVRVWDAQTGQLRSTLRLTAGEVNASPARSLLISPNGQRLAVATDRTIQLWNVDTGLLVKVATQVPANASLSNLYSPALPYSMAFSPDSRFLATVDTDRSVKLWNASSGARVITLRAPDPVQALAFSQDGQTLLTRDIQQSVIYWNLATYQRDRTVSVASGNRLEPIDTNEARATHRPLTLSPDGQTFAVPLTLTVPLNATPAFESSAVIDIRRVSDGERFTVLPGVMSAQFSTDNRLLVTLGDRITVWQP